MVSPFVTAGILLIAFAQCFYTLLQLDCTDALGISPVCSIRDSYRVVYLLLRGDRLVDPTGAKSLSTEAIFLSAAVLISFLVFLLACIVTVLVSTSQLNFDEIALHSYWEPKLAIVLSAGDLGVEKSWLAAESPEGFDKSLAEAWDKFTLPFVGTAEKSKRWYAADLHSRIVNSLGSILVIPLWLIVGLCTLGMLWPPQVRRYIFHPRRMQNNSLHVHSARDLPTAQISSMRSELEAMKLLSFDKANDVQKELRDLKELLFMAMQD
jgi:hypothetical protein